MKVIRILSVVFATIALALSIVCLTDVLDIKVLEIDDILFKKVVNGNKLNFDLKKQIN